MKRINAQEIRIRNHRDLKEESSGQKYLRNAQEMSQIRAERLEESRLRESLIRELRNLSDSRILRYVHDQASVERRKVKIRRTLEELM